MLVKPPQKYRQLRLNLRQPWSRILGAVGHLPTFVSSSEARRDFKEEGLIEASIPRGLPLGRLSRNLSERVIEVPWVLARIPLDTMKLLDVGTTYAPYVYRRLLHRLPVEGHAVDLVPIELPGITGHLADIRHLPFDNDAFDVTICISTLEHVGLDNTVYFGTSAGDVDLAGDATALRELGRVTRPGGRILLTVPGGSYERHDTFRQYSPSRWAELLTEAELKADEINYFAHWPDEGWVVASAEALSPRHYGEGARYAAAIICSSLIPGVGRSRGGH